MTTWQAVHSIVIRAPVKRVFAALLDSNSFGRLFGRGHTTRIVADAPLVDEGGVVEHKLRGLRFWRRVENKEADQRIIEHDMGPSDEDPAIRELDPVSELEGLIHFDDLELEITMADIEADLRYGRD